MHPPNFSSFNLGVHGARGPLPRWSHNYTAHLPHPPNAQVSRAERLLFAPAIDCGPLPLEIGGLESCIRSSSELEALLGKEGR